MTESSPAPDRTMARTVRLRRWSLWIQRGVRALLLGVVLVAAAVIGWLQSDDFEQRAIGLAEVAIETGLGEQATITGINARYWPPGLTANGVHIFNGSTGDTIISAERVRVPIQPRWSGGVGLGEVFLQRPILHLRIDDDGLREFRNRLRPGRAAPARLPFAALRVVDGTLQLDTPQGSVTIEHLELEPGRRGLTDVRGDVTIRSGEFVQRTHVEWPSTQIGPDVVRIPKLGVDLEALSLGGSVTAELGGALEADLEGQMRLDALEPLLGAPRRLGGLLEMTAEVRGTTGDPEAHVRASVTGLEADIPGVLTPLLTYELGDLHIDATATQRRIVVHEAVSTIASGRITASATIDRDDVGALTASQAHLVAADLELEPLLRALDSAPEPWVDLVVAAEADVTGPLVPPDLRGSFRATATDFRVADRPIRDPRAQLQLAVPRGSAEGTLHLDLDAKNLHLDIATVTTPRNSGSVIADIGLEPRGPLDLRFDLPRADLSDAAPLGDIGLTGTGTLEGRLWGPFHQLQLEGAGQIDGFEVIGIRYADRLQATVRSPDMKSLELEPARATLGETSYEGAFAMGFEPPLSMTTQIRVPRGRIEDLTGMFIELEGLTGTVSGTLHLDGPLYELDGGAHLDLEDVDLFGEAFPRGVGRGFMEEGRFTLDELAVWRNDPPERISVSGTVIEEWALDMRLRALGLRLERLDQLRDHDVPLTGTLEADIHLTDTLMDPSPDGRITLDDVKYAGHAVAPSWTTLSTDDGIVTLEGELFGGRAIMSGTIGLWDEQPYDLQATMSKLRAHSLHPIAANGSPLTATLTGSLAVAGHLGPTPSPATLTGQLDDVHVAFEHHVLTNRQPWSVRAEGSHVWIDGVNLQSATSRVDLKVESAEALYLSGDGTVDLDLLRAVVPGLQRAVGTADLDIQAIPGANPRTVVTARADLLRHESAPLTFEEVTAQLEFRPDRISVPKVTARLGGGNVVASGRIDATRWVPTRFDLQMSVDDAQVRWLDTLPPAVGSGTFSFDGPSNHLLLSGSVAITEMDFVERLDWEDWIVSFQQSMIVDPTIVYDEAPLFSLNIDLAADRTIRVRNNLAEATAQADLRVIGDTNRPGLVGNVTMVEGLAFLQDREFRIDRGNVLYDDPWSWDPKLDIALLTDIDTRDQRYRVTYEVFGPLSDWSSSTRSEPPLAQADVNALLWFGVTLEELEERGELSSAVVQGVADLLLADRLLSRQGIGGDVPDLFQIDRIDLATGVNVRGDYSSDPRLVVDKRLREFGDLDLTYELNLRRPDEWFLSAERRLGGRLSLSGWYATLQRDRVLPIGGAYGVDVSARWEIE